MARSRYRFGEDYLPHFMTDPTVAWLPVFANPDFVASILDSWRFLQDERQIDILGWVILENHLHWIAIGPELGKRVGEFKPFTATSILRLMKAKGFRTPLRELEYFKQRHKVDQDYQLWQEGSHQKPSSPTRSCGKSLNTSITIRCAGVMSTIRCIGGTRAPGPTRECHA